MLGEWLPIAMLMGLAALFGQASLYVSSKLGHPKRPNPHKLEPYDCGITLEHVPSDPFPVKFYLLAMLFIIFDVEAIFLYPWAVALRQLGLFGLVEMTVFIGLVFVA
jgi:NADH-quinone oxidoreductase subunit A